MEGAGPEHASALLAMGAVKQEAGIYSEAEELFLRALEIGEHSFGPTNVALIPVLTSLTSARVMGGKVDDAERLALRIVAISETASTEQESDVAILLNDLARLCLKQSAHGVAEPLLLRLLAMKRSKGEDHPEVGTVLASLATVRQALGQHEPAEQLWRRVLEIRERTLAPNHFALAIALEHLAEACAARGKTGEALQHFQRAQTIRELTLGAAHPSLRISRDRIADLQLQAEESPDSPHTGAALAPEKYRLLAVNNAAAGHSLVTSAPAVRERTPPSRKGTARVIEREAPTETITLPPPPPPPPPPVVDFTATEVRAPEADALPYRDLLLSIQQEMDEENGADTAPPEAGFFASVAAALKQRQKATVIGVGSLALLGVLGTASRAWTDSDPQFAGGDASELPSTPIAAPSGAAGAYSRAAGRTSDPAPGTAIASAAATPVTASRTRLADQRNAAKKPAEKSAEPARVSIPKVSASLAAGFDSVVSARSGSGRAMSEPFSVQPPPVVTAPQHSAFEREVAVNQPQRAQLIGSLPVPRYPAQLVDVQGEVRVRFDVDVTGRPVMSTVSVVSSPNSMLTAAVLKVIPGIRFEPARSGGADSKPIGDVVQLGFQFRPTK